MIKIRARACAAARARKRLLYLVYFCILSLSGNLYCAVENVGEDPLNPLKRFDLRFKYQMGVDAQDGKTLILTPRTDQVFYHPGGSQTAIRIDVPFEAFYCPSHCTGNSCYSARRAADSLFQALFIAPPCGNWTFGGGVKFIFPTAGPNIEIGQGKYQILPTLGFRYDLGAWMEGAYLGALVRNASDICGYKSAPHICQLYLQPFLNVNLPDGWFINSSPEMIYNFIEKTWFIPFDLMVGKMITPKVVLSIEYESGIVQDYPKYSQQVELRIGYFF